MYTHRSLPEATILRASKKINVARSIVRRMNNEEAFEEENRYSKRKKDVMLAMEGQNQALRRFPH